MMKNKNMIGKLIKNIFTSKKAKKVLFVLVLLFVCYLAFSLGADCLADGTTNDVQTKMTNFNTIASEVIKCIYVLLWPLIFICGIALDNSLVYGTWLHLDAPLWSMWNVMKNIANFALGGLVLFSILKNLLSTVGIGDEKPLKIIKNTLIAGILIQMSRFLVAAVIDLSTVLTYAVGGLPMTVLNSNLEYSSRPVMSLSINAGSNSNGVKYNIYYKYGDRKVSPCLVLDNLPLTGSYIVGQKMGYLWDSYNDTGFYLDTGYCTLGGWPYRYNHLLSGDGGIYHDIYSIGETGALKNQMYIDFNNSYRPSASGDLQVAIDNCQIIPVDDTKIPQTCRTDHYGYLSFSGDDEFFRGANSENSILYTVDNLIEESKGFVGPLITIYSSLLDIQSFVDIGSESYVETFISLLFKLVFFVVLVAPLVGLAIVLVARIGILWVLIAASPVFILIWVYGDSLKGLKEFLGKTFSLGNIIKLVFAPVIITLSISLSLIFISAITRIKEDPVQRQNVFDSMGIQKKSDEISTYSILGLVDLKLNTTIIGKGKDDFAYFIMLLFSTAIIRFFLIEALKMCGNVGETVGKDWISKNVGELLMSAPIIPLPKGGVGIKALIDVPGNIYNEKVLTPLKDMSRENIEKAFPGLVSRGQKIDLGEAENIVRGELISKIQNNPDIEYRDLTTTQQRAITTYYNNTSTPWDDFAKLKDITVKGIEAKETKTSLDALRYTKAELDMAVKSDSNWKERASGMIGGAVHTMDGVYVVDVVKGTENSSEVQYEIKSRDDYEKAHFGVPIQNVTKDEFNAYEDAKKTDMNNYLKQMSVQYEMLEELKNKIGNENEENKKAEMQAQIDSLNKLFNSELLKKLKELAPDSFNEEEKSGGDS